MGFYYVPPKDGDKYALVGCSNWSELSGAFVSLDEFKISKTDDNYWFHGFASGFHDIKAYKDDSWTFTPQLIKFNLLNKEKQERSFKGETKTRIQSSCEAFICKIIERDALVDRTFKGFIKFENGSFLSMLFDHKDSTLEKQFFKYEDTLPNLIKDDEIKVSDNKGKSFSGKPSQTELEKLNDRIAFMCSQVSMTAGVECKDLSDLIALTKDPAVVVIVDETTDWLFKVIK